MQPKLFPKRSLPFTNTSDGGRVLQKTQASLLETDDCPLDHEYLSADDILLVPRKGILDSRNHAKLQPFIYSSPMDTVTGFDLAKEMVNLSEFPVICRFLEHDWNTLIDTLDGMKTPFFSVGANETSRFSVEYAVKSRYDKSISIAVDVAHGDMNKVLKLYELYSRQEYIHYLMSGTVCTPGAALRVAEAGCTHIRCGVGSGSACSTRTQTSVGVPQLSAIYRIHRVLQKHGLRDRTYIIADGGIRFPGDAVKYLAAGADGIMMGKSFSTSKESAGWKHNRDSWWKFWKSNQLYKRYRGQASCDFQVDHYNKKPACAEGETGPIIHPTTTVKEVVEEYRGGVKSALSYLGLKSMTELNPDNVTFIKITTAAYLEGTPHGT